MAALHEKSTFLTLAHPYVQSFETNKSDLLKLIIGDAKVMMDICYLFRGRDAGASYPKKDGHDGGPLQTEK